MASMHSGWIGKMQEYFDRSTRPFTEADSDFAPVAGMFTVAQTFAHVAHTVDWFAAAAFEGKGFDMDFAGHDKAVRQVTSLAQGRAMLGRSFDRIRRLADATPMEKMMQPVIPADSPIMPGANPIMILSALEDHTAHHRGALTVYSRLRGHVPPMPYMDL